MYGIYESGQVIARFVTPLTVKNNRPESISDTLSLSRNTTRRVGQRWEIETRVEPLSAGANDLFANLVVKGHSETLQVIMPQNIGVIRSRTSNAAVTVTGLIGSDVVTISGSNGIIPRGTFIKFGNHSKVYMVTTKMTADGSMGIYPELRTAITTQPMQYLDDVIMTCLYDSDTVSGMMFDDGLLMDMGSVKLIENKNVTI